MMSAVKGESGLKERAEGEDDEDGYGEARGPGHDHDNSRCLVVVQSLSPGYGGAWINISGMIRLCRGRDSVAKLLY